MDLTLRMGLHIACFHRPEMVGIPDLNYIQCQPALVSVRNFDLPSHCILVCKCKP